MAPEENPQEVPRERALTKYTALIGWYKKNKTKQRLVYQIFHHAAMILTGITPVQIILSDLPEAIQVLNSKDKRLRKRSRWRSQLLETPPAY